MRKNLAGLMLVLLALPAVAQAPDNAKGSDDEIVRGVNAAMDQNGGETEPSNEQPLFERPADAPSSTKLLLRGIAALCVVLALILLAYYGLRRWGKNVPILAGSHFGALLGRIYLDRGNALHFVRVADRVLVVGVNSNSITLVADFDADAFDDGPEEGPVREPAATDFNPDSFLAQLHAQSQEFERAGVGLPLAEEDEIAALRGDIQRLQRYLREESREYEE